MQIKAVVPSSASCAGFCSQAQRRENRVPVSLTDVLDEAGKNERNVGFIKYQSLTAYVFKTKWAIK